MNNLRDKSVLVAFGNRMKALRKENSMTLKDVAFAADMEISPIFRIEKGKINPTLSTLYALSKVFDIELSVLLTFQIDRTFG